MSGRTPGRTHVRPQGTQETHFRPFQDNHFRTHISGHTFQTTNFKTHTYTHVHILQGTHFRTHTLELQETCFQTHISGRTGYFRTRNAGMAAALISGHAEPGQTFQDSCHVSRFRAHASGHTFRAHIRGTSLRGIPVQVGSMRALAGGKAAEQMQV